MQRALKREAKKELKSLRREAKRSARRMIGNIGNSLKTRGMLGTGMRVLGFGDYTVTENSLVAGSSSIVPDFGPTSVRIRHKEYLGNVLGSVGFQGKNYPLNPGMDQTFPWLSGIARNYQQYRLNGVVFQYVSTSAFALGSTNSALGKVILATNYNAEDPPYSSTTGMLATQFSNYCRPADTMSHAIECAPIETSSNVYYIRTDLDGKQKDLRITDLGFTQISTEGMQSTTEVGGLWISYDVTLFKPILNPQNAISDGFDQFVFQANPAEFFNSKMYIRNNTLGGSVIQVGPTGFDYVWDSSVSSGYFLSILEFDPNIDSKISYINVGSGFHSYTNCEPVSDVDKNGPFNGQYIGTANYVLATILQSPYTQSGSTQTSIVELIKVTGPNPNLTLTNLSLSGTSAMYWRWSFFPISYSTTPQDSEENFVAIPTSLSVPVQPTTEQMLVQLISDMQKDRKYNNDWKH